MALIVFYLLPTSSAISAGSRRYHDMDYISLHRAGTEILDLTSAHRFCATCYDQIAHFWVNRSGLRDVISTRVNDLVEEVLPSVRGSRGGCSGTNRSREWLPFSPSSKQKSSVLKKTAVAATVATKTVSLVASAALRTPETASEKASSKVDFAQFGDQPVATTLVSANPRENSILLASLKSRKKKESSVALATKHDVTGSQDLKHLMDPLIPQSLWNRLTGNEFPEHMELLEGLARTGYRLSSNDESNEWVAWTKVSSSFKESLEEGGIHVWTGRKSSDDKSYYGAAAPFIKSRSIVPLSPMEFIELLLDSNRVKAYNKWSTGRLDLWKSSDERTKIVQNTNNVPVGGKPLRSTTLLHACPVDSLFPSKKTQKPGEETSWLLLSRAVGPQPEDKNIGTSDILLGVNLIQPHGEGESVLTAITHVYSTAVPGMLAEKLGVKSAIKFVKDIRGMVVPVS